MIRISTIFFCLLLAAAAVGRYRAEASVRAERAEIDQIEQGIKQEQARISKLQLEVEVLESPKRLAQLGAANKNLQPIQPHQVLTAEKFAALMGDEAAQDQPANESFIVDAIAMSDLGTVQR